MTGHDGHGHNKSDDQSKKIKGHQSSEHESHHMDHKRHEHAHNQHKELAVKHEHTADAPHDHHDMEKAHGHGDGHGDHGALHHHHHAHMVEDFRKRFWISLILTIPILILSPMIQRILGLGFIQFPGSFLLLWVISSVVFFYGGYPFLKGMVDELKKRTPGMMTLIALAILVAYLYSSVVVFGLSGKFFFWELATLIDIMLLGHWIEMKSVMGASMALEELAKLLPTEAHKVDEDGNVSDTPIEMLMPGDKVLVKPGEKIPVDGIVVKGETSVNESMITGESKPVSKSINDRVIGGSINGEGAIFVLVQKTGNDSFLAQVIDLVKEAQQSKSKTQDLANRAAFWLTIIAILSGTITMFVWFFLINKDFAFALERTVTVMVITCPHALGLAVPLVVAVSTAVSAKNGLLIRNRAAFEAARNIGAIIFDKTGTLTKGEFGVTEVIVLNDKYSEEEILIYAASVESQSEHPIAKGIVGSAKNTLEISDFQSIPGKGAEAVVQGKKVMVVSPGYLKEQGISMDNKRIFELNKQGKTVIYVLINKELCGAIALADIIRPESKDAIKRLKGMGIQTMMLTGDNLQVAKWVADELGLDGYFAEVLPQEKASKIKEVQAKGLIVAMTGDGVNDAPALVQADVGIAIGAGTDVAVEAADIVLVRSNPMDVVFIIGLAKATYKKMIQNLIWATGYNAFAIPLAAGVLYKYGILLSPAIGAVLMSLSTVIVSINAKFLKVR